MNRLNNFVRIYLAKKLILPLVILMFLNLFLLITDLEYNIKLIVLLISVTIIAVSILSLMLYPKFMSAKKSKFMVNCYRENLDQNIKSWTKQITKIHKKIKKINETDIQKFIICKKHHLHESPENDTKLLSEAHQRRTEILEALKNNLNHLLEDLDKYEYIKNETQNNLKVKSHERINKTD